MQKRKKGQTESPGSREEVGLNQARETKRAEEITGKPGKSRPKSSKRDEKGRQNHREAWKK